MLEPKVRPIAGSNPLIQTAGSELLGLLGCGQEPAPEDWENYLVLSLIDQERFLRQPPRFQNAYADVVLRLRSAGLLVQAAASPALTRAGRAWIERFSANYL